MPIDPTLQQILDQLPATPDGPLDYPAMREQSRTMTPMLVGSEGPAQVASAEDIGIDGPAGPVRIRIYRPVGQAAGTLHYIHGGGWAVGDLDGVDHTARRFCRDLSMVVVSSTYRLAPEHPFPAPYDDSMAAARWVLHHRGDLGGADRPVIVSGDSAGGNLAAAICLGLREAPGGTPSFDVQLLLYPAVDLRPDAAANPSRRRDADPALRVPSLDQLFGDYIAGTDPADTRISPLAAADLSGLPPALIVVLSVDPLRDEAVAYADALGAAGVSSRLIEFDNLVHGFVHLAGVIPAAGIATRRVMTELETMLPGIRAA